MAAAAAGADMVEVDTLIFDIDDTLYGSVCVCVCLPACACVCLHVRVALRCLASGLAPVLSGTPPSQQLLAVVDASVLEERNGA